MINIFKKLFIWTASSLLLVCILSFAMALRYSFDEGGEATRLEHAIQSVLASGVRTPDLMQRDGDVPVTTTQMGDAVIKALNDSI